jgi:hypothetical protein
MDMRWIIKYSRLSESASILQSAHTRCAPVSYFLSFFDYHTPSHGVSFGTHRCKPLMHHLVHFHKFRQFQCLWLEKTLHTFMTGPSVSLCHKQLMIQCCRKPKTTLSSLLIISNYRGISNVKCFPLPVVHSLLT